MYGSGEESPQMAFTNQELKELAQDERAGGEYADSHLIIDPNCEAEGCDFCNESGFVCPEMIPCAFCIEWQADDEADYDAE